MTYSEREREFTFANKKELKKSARNLWNRSGIVVEWGKVHSGKDLCLARDVYSVLTYGLRALWPRNYL